MSAPKPTGKVTTRSLRLDTTWNDAINQIAKQKGTSTSALIEQICRDYVLFYQWVENLHSIIFSPKTIMPVIDMLTVEQLKSIAETAAESSFRESYLARGYWLDIDTVRFQIVDQMARYANWFTVVEHKNKHHYFYIQHGYGEKWSVFVETFLCTLFMNFSELDVSSERVDRNIVLRLDEKS